MDFVKEIEAATGRKLISIDIGGGLSSTYKGKIISKVTVNTLF